MVIGAISFPIWFAIVSTPNYFGQCGALAIANINIWQKTDVLSGVYYDGIFCTQLPYDLSREFLKDTGFIIITSNQSLILISLLGVAILNMIVELYKVNKKKV